MMRAPGRAWAGSALLAIPLAGLLSGCRSAPGAKDSPGRDSPGRDSPGRDSAARGDSAETAGESGDTGRGPGNVLILVMDGVRARDFTRLEVSEITGVPGVETGAQAWATLGAAGTVVRAAVQPGITNTSASHAALFTGRFQPYGTMAQEDALTLYHPEHPTLFEAAWAAGIPAGQIRLVVNTQILHDAGISAWPGLGLADPVTVLTDGDHVSREDADVFAALQEEIRQQHPRLLVANIHDVDRQGHAEPGGDYPGGVAAIDGLLGGFYRWLQQEEPAWLADTLIILTNDHGRHHVPVGQIDPYWAEHGDSCQGCREQPLFVVGAGIAAGRVVEGRYLQPDVTATAAAWLGLEMPFTEGLPLDFALADAPARGGEVGVAAAGGVVATRAYLGDLERRSEVRAGGEVLSDPGATDVGDVAAAEVGGESVVCWREWRVDEEEDAWPWLPVCAAGGPGAWRDIGFPEDHDLSPVWAVRLYAEGDRLYAAWVDNHNGATTAGQAEDPIGINLASWTAAGGWTEAERIDALFPTLPALAADGGRVVAAWGASRVQSDARLTRGITVRAGAGAPVRLSGEGVLGGTMARLERPALRVSGAAAGVAMLGWDDADHAEGALLYAESADGGRTWGTPGIIEAGGQILPNLSPQFVGALLYRGVLDEAGQALLCRGIPGEAPECRPAGSPRIDSFAADAAGAWLSVDAGVGQWELRRIDW